MMDPKLYAQLTMEMDQLSSSLNQFKKQLWWDQISNALRSLLEPYELKPVLQIVIPFLGLLLGFILGHSLLGIWAGVFFGLLLAGYLAYLFFRILFVGDLAEIQKSCQDLPAKIEALTTQLAEKKRDFEAAYLEGLNAAKQKVDPKTGKSKDEKSAKEEPEGDSASTLPRISKWRSSSPAEFRSLVESTFRELGYQVQVPEKVNQFGVQLIVFHSAQRIVVKIVGEPIQVTQGAVQQVFSAKTHFDCDCCLVITPGTFSMDARKLARSTKVILVGQLEMEKFLSGNVFPKIVQ